MLFPQQVTCPTMCPQFALSVQKRNDKKSSKMKYTQNGNLASAHVPLLRTYLVL